jgi:signal transduction histidine kinase
MKHIDQIKLNEVAPKIQVMIFDNQGVLIESCDTLIKADPTQKLFDQFVFLESLAEVFPTLAINERFDFPEVLWTEQRKALFSLSFQKVSNDRIQLVILDKTLDYDRLLDIQQSRNNSAMSEEVAQLQNRVAEMENQLLEFQNLELKRIQAFKNEFFAKVSHEMRTPLSSIGGLVSLIEANNKKLHYYLPALRATSQHLNSIVNDILDTSKIEAGKLVFESVDFDLKEEIENVLSGFQFESQQKGLQLDLDFPTQLTHVKSDPIRIKQVLYNLIGNSLKFTEKGGVSLWVELLTEEADGFYLKFKIKDTGIGMTEEQIKKVLAPYAQAEESIAREYGGTGLGMGIAIKLIEAFGGKLSINTQIAQGTEMSFQLKILKGKSPALATADDGVIEGLKIMLAEDDPVNRAILNEFLEAKGVQLTVVESGEE